MEQKLGKLEDKIALNLSLPLFLFFPSKFGDLNISLWNFYTSTGK